MDECLLLVVCRVQTILDSDLVLVLANGRVVEFDPPATLLADPTSYVYSVAVKGAHI